MIYGVMDVTMEALASLVTSEQNMNLDCKWVKAF